METKLNRPAGNYNFKAEARNYLQNIITFIVSRFALTFAYYLRKCLIT